MESKSRIHWRSSATSGGQFDDTFAIAEIFLNDGKSLHNLLQKAVGWLIRETYKKDEGRLREWLNAHSREMPRTMLRYAIEKFPENERKAYLK